MKFNKWTLGLAAVGLVSLTSVQADEAKLSNVETALSSTIISGYVSTSAIWNPGTTGSGAASTAGVRAYDGAGKFDQFNLDVVNLTISKPLDEGEWAAGYKVELLFGPDANALATSSTFVNTADFNIKQAYVNLRAPIGNGLEFKLGVWDTIIGYEAFNAGDNPNYSRSMGFGLEPTTHTGIQAAYKFNDMVSAVVGVANGGSSATINAPGSFALHGETQKAYMAAVTLTAPSDWGFISGSSLTAGIIDSPVDGLPLNGFATSTKDLLNLYVGASLNTPLEALKVGLSWDYRANGGQFTSAATFPPSGIGALGTTPNASYANAFDIYTSYQVTEKFKINTRAEYVTATGGTYYLTDPLNKHANNEIFSLVGTFDYSLWANVITRAEVRWDHALTGGGFPGYPTGNPFGAVGGIGLPDDKNLLTVAVNVIYKF